MTAAQLAGATLLLVALPAWGQDAARGKQLYETHCGGCHYERVHQRERGRLQVKSPAGLRREVARWAMQLKRPLALEDLDDIAEYLERTYYRFDK